MTSVWDHSGRQLLVFVGGGGFYNRPCTQRFACIGFISIVVGVVALFLGMLLFYCLFKRDYLKACITANRKPKPPQSQQMALPLGLRAAQGAAAAPGQQYPQPAAGAAYYPEPVLAGAFIVAGRTEPPAGQCSAAAYSSLLELAARLALGQRALQRISCAAGRMMLGIALGVLHENCSGHEYIPEPLLAALVSLIAGGSC